MRPPAGPRPPRRPRAPLELVHAAFNAEEVRRYDALATRLLTTPGVYRRMVRGEGAADEGLAGGLAGKSGTQDESGAASKVAAQGGGMEPDAPDAG